MIDKKDVIKLLFTSFELEPIARKLSLIHWDQDELEALLLLINSYLDLKIERKFRDLKFTETGNLCRTSVTVID